jgi:hypothetical protein
VYLRCSNVKTVLLVQVKYEKNIPNLGKIALKPIKAEFLSVHIREGLYQNPTKSGHGNPENTGL